MTDFNRYVDWATSLKGHERFMFWHDKWHKAYGNMPWRAGKWDPPLQALVLPDHPVSVPDFISGSVKGEYVLQGSTVYAVILITEYKYGQQSLLGKMMWPKHKAPNNSVYTATQQGSCPRDRNNAVLLLKLAGPQGNDLAWTWLRNCNRAHLYVRAKA